MSSHILHALFMEKAYISLKTFCNNTKIEDHNIQKISLQTNLRN